MALLLACLAVGVGGAWSWVVRDRIGTALVAVVERFRAPQPAARRRTRIVQLRAGQAAAVAASLEVEARRRGLTGCLIAPHEGTNALLLEASASDFAALERYLGELERR